MFIIALSEWGVFAAFRLPVSVPASAVYLGEMIE